MKILVVLGYRLLPDNKMHNILKKRLNTCISNYLLGDKIIVSGGNACMSKCNHTEAYIMCKYLLATLPINRKDIYLENKSLDTIENIKNILKILNREHFLHVYIISSNWHIPRIEMACDTYLPSNIGITYIRSL
jgi:uncharacterized SAM-binding protein YcdF (DUF218 family)